MSPSDSPTSSTRGFGSRTVPLLVVFLLSLIYSPVAAQSAQAVLDACQLTLQSLTPATNDTLSILTGYPQLLPWAASTTLPVAPANSILILSWIESGSCHSNAVARSYASASGGNNAWEGVRPRPVEPDCSQGGGNTCTINSQNGPVLPTGAVNPAPGAYVLHGFTRLRAPLTNAEAASRFLAQATFGPTQADIAALLALHSAPLNPTAAAVDTDTTHFAAWINAQRALPPSLLRSHLRNRISTRDRGDELISGRLSKPCDINSRWNTYAFTRFDEGFILKVDRVGSTAGTCYYSLVREDDVVMTEVLATFAENCTDGLPSPRYFRICAVREPTPSSYINKPQVSLVGPFPQAAPLDCTATQINVPLPSIRFSSPDVTTTQMYAAGDVTLTPVEAVKNSFILSARRTGVVCNGAERKLFSYIGVVDTNTTFYRLDRRRTLVENTPNAPTDITDPEWATACPSVDPTFLNRDGCVLHSINSTVCSTTTYLDGTSFFLDTTHLRYWYVDTNRYVYAVQNLRLDAFSNVRPPCTRGEISRWIRTSGACSSGAWNEPVAVSAIRAGKADPNANPDIVDVVLSLSGTCATDASTIGAKVTVDSDCWTHSHPNERDVFDFTQWYSEHPGGSDNIAKWARNNLVTINFPASHPMTRWYENFQTQQYGYHPRLGRLGDRVEFSALPREVQTPEMATRVGAVSVQSSTAFLACGSRGETRSEPSLGHRYIGIYYDRTQGLDREYPYYSTAYSTAIVWHSVALSAVDQLRHKVAWALGQIIVARGDDFIDGNAEPMSAFYDIFVQNALGNYRDILREVSASPVMGRYLTFHGNRAFAVSGFFPDENYAREVMQLFSIGVFTLDAGGIETRDPVTGDYQLTYTNNDIENGARVWTGWQSRSRRRNLILLTRTETNMVDPMNLIVENRDLFPKTRISGGFLGDGYPLCQDLPPRHFLAQGAKYILTGESSALGKFYDGVPNLNNSVARDHYTPTTASALYAALCGSATGACTFPGVVTLASTLTCSGPAECEPDTMRVVKIVASSGLTGYYKYVEPVCTYLAFFDNGRIIKNSGAEQCANPEVPISAGVTCCDSGDEVYSNGGGECKFLAEPMRYSTALQRCSATHGSNVSVCKANSWILNQQYPVRDRFNAAVPTLPVNVTIRKNRACEISGTYNGITRWRIGINTTQASNVGASGPLVLAGVRPDTTVAEFPIDRIQYWSNGGNYMYFVPFASQALYDSLGDDALANFNALFPDGTVFSIARMGYGSDPTGERGTNDRWAQFCAAWQYQWSSDRCSLSAEIDSEGSVSLLDPRGANSNGYSHLRWLREGSGNKFDVDWNAPLGTPLTPGQSRYPTIGADGFCTAIGCVNRTRTCVCRLSVQNVAVYTNPATAVETPSIIRSKLKVGAFAPGAGYTKCTTTACTAQTSVEVWTKGTSAAPLFDTDTIFVLNDQIGLRSVARYLKNIESTVVVGTTDQVEVRVPASGCNVSSFYQNQAGYNCTQAIDNNLNTNWATNGQGVGSWIDVFFATPATLTRMEFSNRCGPRERSRDLRLDFSDGSQQFVTLSNNSAGHNECAMESFDLTLVQTTSVRITVLSAYSELNNGARDINFFGPAGPNGFADPRKFNFRNPPHFMPNTGAFGRTPPADSSRYELYGWPYWTEKGIDETEALLDSLIEHPNTPTMLSLQLIQKLVTSNPSPRYVRTCATAFKTGTYAGVTFSGKHGDMAATVACILLDREARATVLDLDPNHGKLQEPLLKIMHLMRSMEFQARDGVEPGLIKMQTQIGEGAFDYPSVFSFFSPFYKPPGPVADAGLVSPETQILAAPQLVNFLNGMDSLVDNGLTNCLSGFGDDSDNGNKRDYCRTSSLPTSDDGRLQFALPSQFADVELIPAGQCVASIEPSPSTSRACYSAVDGRTTDWSSDRNGVGAWIELSLSSSPVSIDTLKMSNRCPNSLRNQDVAVVFSDGTNVTVTLPDNCTLTTFTFSAVSTTFVRIVVLSLYNSTTDTYNGATEIQFYSGTTAVPVVACSASSEYAVSRSNTCRLSPAVGTAAYEGWSVQGSGVSSWTRRDFSQGAQTIGRVQYASRCGPARPRSVLLEFSDGSQQTIEMANLCDPPPAPIQTVTTTFVKGTVLSVYNSTGAPCCDCGRYIRRFNVTDAPSGVVCESYLPGKAAEFRFWNSRQKAAVMDVMSTLLAPGRASALEKSVIGDAYEREYQQDEALRRVLRLFAASSSFHVTNDPVPLTDTRPPFTPVSSGNRDYKAVITILLAGGADSFSMLVPHTCSPVDLFDEYTTVRGPGLALGKSTLLPITPRTDSPPQPCSTFGLHPSLVYLSQAFAQNEAILFANTGAMVELIDNYTVYRRGTKQQPEGNFGHNGMQRNIQSLDAKDHLAKGVIGRSIGVLSSPPLSYKSAMYSLVGQMKILEGSLTPSIINSGTGVVRYVGLSELGTDLAKLHGQRHNSIFAETFSDTLDESIASTEILGNLLKGTSLVTDVTQFTGFSAQLREVAKLIRVDNMNLTVERSGFIVQQGGYDTHATFDLTRLLDDLDKALRLFSAEMKAQGLWDKVAIQVISDFGRTLTSNAQGTDHAWGGNYMLLGGRVRGGRILGKFPESLAEGNPLDMGRGRLIPTTPFESIWNGIVEWFGVPASSMSYILPNKANFPAGSLYAARDLFSCVSSSDCTLAGATCTAGVCVGGSIPGTATTGTATRTGGTANSGTTGGTNVGSESTSSNSINDDASTLSLAVGLLSLFL